MILLDDLEKADADVFKTLLQVLNECRIMDGQGRTVNFSNSMVLMNMQQVGAFFFLFLEYSGELRIFVL